MLEKKTDPGEAEVGIKLMYNVGRQQKRISALCVEQPRKEAKAQGKTQDKKTHKAQGKARRENRANGNNKNSQQSSI